LTLIQRKKYSIPQTDLKTYTAMGMLANITNKIPYGAHVIVLFVLTFAAFILT
jgi:hypothetical protein